MSENDIRIGFAITYSSQNGTMPPNHVLVCIPTYNEAENIAGIIDRTLLAVPEAHILVVDDHSPDGTGKIADHLAITNNHVFVLHRKEKAGLGAAYLAAFAWGLERNYSVLVEMDADGSHQPEQLPTLLAGLDRAQIVVGARWIEGGSVTNWSRRRRLISRAGSWYARACLGLKQRDATSGFRAYQAEGLTTLLLEPIRSEGYSFQIEILWRASRAGQAIAEVPILFTDRERGVSKMNARIVFEAVLRVTSWGILRVVSRRSRPKQATRPSAPTPTTPPSAVGPSTDHSATVSYPKTAERKLGARDRSHSAEWHDSRPT